MAKRDARVRLTLSSVERFELWGRRVGYVIIDGSRAHLYSGTRALTANFIGTVDWENLPQLANPIRGYRR